jgi:predicted amidohydrolase
MTMDFKIALVQQKAIPDDLCANTKNGIEYIKKAKSLGADLVLFSECWLNAYKYPDIDTTLPLNKLMEYPQYKAWFDSAMDENSSTIQRFCSVAEELHIGVAITCFTKGEERPQNSVFIIDKNGKILMKYSKVHTCDFYAEALCESGKEFKVCEFDGVKLGAMICFDRERSPWAAIWTGVFPPWWGPTPTCRRPIAESCRMARRIKPIAA